MLDAQLARLDRLEYLHDLNLPVDVSHLHAIAIPEIMSREANLCCLTQLPDISYEYREVTQEQVDSQGPYLHHNEQGVYVPAVEQVGVSVSQLQIKQYQLPEEPKRKRKAGNDHDEQPGSKRLAVEEDDLPVRHVKSMLSAVEEIPERSASQGAAARAGDGYEEPIVGDVEEVNGLPVPKGASLPDEHGVRIITKARDKRANNRIMAPSSVILDDWQIGFRDSTNHPDKGATRARRGEYFQQANSHAMYYDRKVAEWNSTTQAAEDYDQALVRKHHLHPRLGIFLPSSVNRWEKPEHKAMDQYRPVVHVGPKGQIIHSSGSVPGFRLDQEGEKEELRTRLKGGMTAVMEEAGIAEEEVVPNREIRAKHRQDVLFSRAIDPESLPTPRRCLSPEQVSELEASHEDPEESATRETLALGQAVREDIGSDEAIAGINEILEAAAFVQEREKKGKEKEQHQEEEEVVARVVAKPQAQSRPYDAVRDLFTEASSSTAVPPPEPATASDTYSLSLLADLAEERAEEEQAAHDTSMMDPALFSSVGEAWPRQPEESVQQQRPAATEPSAKVNDFLRMTLNPQTPSPVYPPPPPPASDYPSPQLRGALPSLRPTTASPPEFGPGPRPNFVASNSGHFYPPAPPRPYHNGYSHQGPVQHPVMMPPPPPAPRGQYPPMQPMMAPYPPPASPMGQPQYGQSPLGPATAHTNPYGGPVPATPSSQQIRGRPGSSGNKQQYRKLEPAPTPPTRNRQAGGQPREFRTVPFDYRESIKDYTPIEAPPSHGPNQIRGWSHQNLKPRRVSKADGPVPEDPS